MNRRRFVVGGLTMLGAGGSLSALYAQRTYRIGVLINGSERSWGGRLAALRAGLKDLGYAEGRTLALAVRWSDGVLERLPDLAAELLRENPDAFVCAPVLAAAAVHKQTRSVPIVIAAGAGAVKVGLANSFARPGGNVTGLENQNEDLTPKHLELLKTVAPGISRVAVLNTSTYPFHEEAWRAASQAAKALKLTLLDVRIEAAGELARLESTCGKGGCNALYAMPGPYFINWRTQIVEEAARLRLPAIYYQPEFAQDGGLMSYSPNVEEMFRRAAGYVDKILRGARPAELPIERPTKFELVINLKAARALGLSIADSMLARADRVIQ